MMSEFFLSAALPAGATVGSTGLAALGSDRLRFESFSLVGQGRFQFSHAPLTRSCHTAVSSPRSGLVFDRHICKLHDAHPHRSFLTWI